MRILVRSALLSAMVMLAACSGGSGGGGGGGTGSTPPPPPAQSMPNNSLADLRYSENFANDNAHGTITSNSTSTQSRALTVRYEASSHDYVLTSGNVSQRFGTSDIVQQDAAARYYNKVSDNTEDVLVLTKPGASGPLTYQYVGGGLWRRIITSGITSGNDYTGSGDAFAYGVQTPAADVPRTGSASFDVSMIGTSGLTTYSGTGTIDADFASAMLIGALDVTEVLGDGHVNPFVYTMTLDGRIAGSGNSFTGNFATNVLGWYRGAFEGSFYGPQSQEIGLAFHGQGTKGLESRGLIGFIIGRRASDTASVNLSLANLVSDQQFRGAGANVFYSLRDDDGTVASSDGTTGVFGRLSYHHNEKSWQLQFGPNPGFGPFNDNDIVNTGDTRFITYQNADGERLRIYRPGSDNPELQLTYASFAIGDEAESPVSGQTLYHYSYTTFGTAVSTLPISGSGSYAGRLYGHGLSGSNVYTLTGTSSFTISFQQMNIEGKLSPIATPTSGGGPISLGDFSFAGGLFPDASFNTDVDFEKYRGSAKFFGSLYGPNGQEFGAAFGGIYLDDPLSPDDRLYLNGISVGKRN